MVSRGKLAAAGLGVIVLLGILIYIVSRSSSASSGGDTEGCKVSDWSDWGLCDKDCGGGLRKRTRSVVSYTDATKCPPLSQVEPCNSVACPPEECKLSDWSEWSACSTECGTGTQTRTREILNNVKAADCPDIHQSRDCKIRDCPEECKVGEWSQWSECDRPCGGGSQRRTRDVVAPHVGSGCPANEDVKACNTQQCPVDCQVSEWGDWSECDKICGGGTHHRSRDIVVQPAGGGKDCPVLHEQAECNTQECYQDCKVGDWSNWSDCSKTCGGGVTTRSREITQPQIGRGVGCPETTQTAPCNTEACAQDCVVSDWSAWSACSQDCGGGTQSRTRSIIRPQIGSGKVCPPLIESQTCNSVACATDCQVGDWSEWSQCNASCGGGVRERSRAIVHDPSAGGVGCPSTIEHEQCNIQECSIDCRVSDWSNWSSCSQECGGGTQSRTRSITQQPNSTGQSCPNLVETQECNKQECMPDNCVLSEWTNWSSCSGCGEQLQKRTRTLLKPGKNPTAECSFLEETRPCSNPACPVNCQVSQWSDWAECDAVCGGGKTHRDRFIVTAPRNGGTECPPLREESTCNTQACPIDCQMGEWSEWSACNKSCGGGVQMRNRPVLVEPAQGGNSCPSTQEVKDCNTQTCPQDCVIGDWSGWSGCDKPCGGGKQSRTRSVITSAHDGGRDCPELIEYHDCNTQECPIDCAVGQWSEWSGCSKPCGGGIRTQSRPVTQEAKSGGIGCPATSRSEECNTQPCDVDCQVGEWSPWSACDKTCGGGIQKRVRSITSYPVANGKQCPPLEETQSCNSQECPVNCQVGDWGEWSNCSVPCGGGLRKRARLVIQQPMYGGYECPSLDQIGDCNTQECVVKVINNVVPRNVKLFIGFGLKHGNYLLQQTQTSIDDFDSYCATLATPCQAASLTDYLMMSFVSNRPSLGLSTGIDQLWVDPVPSANNTLVWTNDGKLYFDVNRSRYYITDYFGLSSDINQAVQIGIEYIGNEDPQKRSVFNKYNVYQVNKPNYSLGMTPQGLTANITPDSKKPYVTVAVAELVK
jgi:hypothetical protein